MNMSLDQHFLQGIYWECGFNSIYSARWMVRKNGTNEQILQVPSGSLITYCIISIFFKKIISFFLEMESERTEDELVLD